ncbi:MAG: hypothetical protein WA796_11600 [Pseudolabrys sp.]
MAGRPTSGLGLSVPIEQLERQDEASIVEAALHGDECSAMIVVLRKAARAAR